MNKQNQSKDVKIGKYMHYKGGIATVIGIAKHSETQEKFVVYDHVERQTGKNRLWIRPKDMFLETVEVDGKRIPRFSPVKE